MTQMLNSLFPLDPPCARNFMDSELNRHAFVDIEYESMSREVLARDNSSISGLAVDLRKG